MAGSFEAGSIVAKVKADLSDFKQGMDDAKKQTSSLKNYLDDSTAASKKFAAGMTVLAAGAVAFGVASVKAFSDSEQKIAQTNAVLKSTGSIAGVTADQVTKLASALERQTKYSDEDVRSVENLLLTFTSIGKDIFPQATKTVLDMATALGEDTSSASIQLGKALQDPVLGITALRRVGVNFSEDQKTVIQNLVETGQKAKAQQLILKELNTEFGGSAEAAGNTLSGSLAKLKNQFNNVQEAIGGILATVAVPFLTKIMEWFNGIGGVDGVLKLLRDELDRLKPYLPVIAGAIGGMLAPALFAAAAGAAEFILTLAPWAALGAAVVIVAKKLGVNMDDLQGILFKAKVYLGDFVIGLRLIKDTITGGDPTLKTGEDRFAGIAIALSQARDMVLNVVHELQNLWNAFVNSTPVIIFIQFIQQVALPALAAIWAAIVQNLMPALGQLWDAFMRLWNALNPALMDALKIIGALLGGLLLAAIYLLLTGLNIAIQVFSMVISVISNVINWIANLIGWFGNLVGVVWNTIRTIITIFSNLVPAIKDVIGLVVGIFATLGSMIIHAIGDVSHLLYDIGKKIIDGLINGIKDKFGDVKQTLGDLTKKLTSWKGPESVDKKILFGAGRFVIGGFVEGLQSSFGDVQNTLGSLTAGLAPAALSPQANDNSVRTTIYGGVNIGSNVDADNFLARLTKNQELAAKGLTPV